MTTSRDHILSRLRMGLHTPGPLFRDQIDHTDPPASPSPVTGIGGTDHDLSEEFLTQLRKAGGDGVIFGKNDDPANHAADIIAQWLQDQKERTAMSWDRNALYGIDIETALHSKNIELAFPKDLHDSEERQFLEKLTVGVTGVTAAFAGTGTVALTFEPGRSRSASLLPLYHLVLVPTSRIFSNAESWIAELNRTDSLKNTFVDSSQVIFITGPSKSADIELNLTTGVHGPKIVYSIVYEG